MGYLISAYILPGERDFSALNTLPSSFGYAVYFHEGIQCHLLDIYASRKPPKFPFCSLVPAAELPLDLATELNLLNQFYEVLVRLNRANGFKRSYVNLALLLSQRLSTDVMSFVTNDDQLDFACTVREGALTRLRFRCDDLLVTYSAGGLLIEPSFSEDEPDADWLTDLEDLRAALPFAEIKERTIPMPTALHSLATREVAGFTGATQPILGLGSFDGPQDQHQWRKILQR
jgi:hypothetical protein